MPAIIQFLYKIWVFVVYNNPNPYANETGDDIVELLEEFADYLTIGSPFGDVIRSIGFGLIKTMDTLTHALLTILGKAYDVVTFDAWLRESSTINGTVLQRLGLSQTGTYIAAIFPIALVITGIILMFGANEIKGSKILKNIALGAFVLAVLPWAISMMGSLTQNFYSENNITIAEEARSQASGYIYDVEWIFTAENQNYQPRLDARNEIADKYLFMIDINQRIDPTGEGEENVYAKKENFDDWKILRFQQVVQGGTAKTVRIKQVSVGKNIRILQNYYYRFHFEFIPLFLLYAAYIAVIVFTIARCIRLAYEIVVNHLIVTFLAATDFLSGKKLKEALQYLFYTFLVLMYAIVSIVLFSKFITFVSVTGANKLKLDDLGDYAGLAQALIIFVVALAVIDGPALIQRLTGIDAGLRDGYNAMDRLMHMGRGAARMVGGVARTAKNIGNNMVNADKKAKRAVDAFGGGHHESPQQTAEREQNEANKKLQKADKSTGKSIPITKTGNANGQKTATKNDIARAAKKSGAGVVQVGYSMKKKDSAAKNSDRNKSHDTLKGSFAYDPKSKSSFQQQLQNHMNNNANLNGEKASDYNLDTDSVSLMGYSDKASKNKDADGVDTLEGQNVDYNANHQGGPVESVIAPTGTESPSGTDTEEQAGELPFGEQAGAPAGGGTAPSGNAGTPGNVNPPRRTSGNNTGSPQGAPQGAPQGVPQGTSQVTTRQGTQQGTRQGTTQGTQQQVSQQRGANAGGGGNTVSAGGRGNNTPAQSSSSSRGGSGSGSPSVPRQTIGDDYEKPVATYRANASSYTQLPMEIPTHSTQKNWAEAADKSQQSDQGIGTGNMVYTQIEMVSSEPNMQAQTIGFNYAPGDGGGGYKKAFNGAVSRWKEQRPENNDFKINHVDVYKTKATNDR